MLLVVAGMLAPCGAVSAAAAGVQPRQEAGRSDEAGRLVELLAEEAVGAMRMAAWHEGELLSPVLGCALEFDHALAVAMMVEPVRPRGAAVWSAMRLGRKTPEGARASAAIDAADTDLDRACALLVREAVVVRLRTEDDRRAKRGTRTAVTGIGLGDGLAFPPALVREAMEALPAPPTNPAADPVVMRMVDRFERGRRLARQSATEAERIGAELARMQARAEEWRSRFDALADAIAARAGDAEGRAIVAAMRTERLALAGWGPPRSRAREPVLGAVQLAMLERPPCAVLAEVLLELRARKAERIDSLCVSPEGALLVGRGVSELTQETIDRWRTACGLKRTGRGWEGLPDRRRARPSRIRDSPFGSGARTGVMPARPLDLGYAPRVSSDATRYQRQMQLPRFGLEGQERLAAARVLVAGCGALGTVVCEQLARAGVGSITVIDRDLVERSNLQRQTLFTEQDARRAVPKAEAAKARLAAVNAAVTVRALVDDIHAGNARRATADCDIVVDCLDNFETRAILNDCAVERRVPLVYGGAVGMTGMAAALLPCDGGGTAPAHGGRVRWSEARATPCLRCLLPELPRPGEVATCETEGVLAATAGIVGSIEAALVLRLVAEGAEHVPAEIVRFDLGSLRFGTASLGGARDPACPCCAARRFEYLDGAGMAATQSQSPSSSSERMRVLCGRNAVEVGLGAATEAGLDGAEFARLVARLAAAGEVASDVHGGTRVARVALGDGLTLSVIAGTDATRAIVDGTRDPELARSLVARWIGV